MTKDCIRRYTALFSEIDMIALFLGNEPVTEGVLKGRGGGIKSYFPAQILPKSYFQAYCFPDLSNLIPCSIVYLLVILCPSDPNSIF